MNQIQTTINPAGWSDQVETDLARDHADAPAVSAAFAVARTLLAELPNAPVTVTLDFDHGTATVTPVDLSADFARDAEVLAQHDRNLIEIREQAERAREQAAWDAAVADRFAADLRKLADAAAQGGEV